MLGALFRWFYCLPVFGAALLMAVMTLFWFLLKKEQGKRRIWRWAVGALLVLWTAAMVYSTIISRERGGTMQHFFLPLYSYRAVLHGDNPEILRSNFMNVMLFYPAGLLTVSLLPEKWPRRYRVLLVLALFTAVSASVEYTQYVYALGRVETDDVIHNALGAFLGAWIGGISLKP